MKILGSVFLYLILFTTPAKAQSTRLNGKVVNDKNEPLAGVSIKVAATTIGVTTDVEGRYSLALSPGKKYSLEVSAVGYATKTIDDVDVIAGQENELNILLEINVQDLGGVTVRSTTRRQESTSSLLNIQKNNTALSSGLAADFIRRTPDKNTGEVLKRVSG